MTQQLYNTVVHNPEIKILAVDDRDDNLLSIETILNKESYTIRKARSGREALKILLKEQDFTIILMDVQMPDLSGFETAAMIYESDKMRRIPIIFITANDHGDENMFKGYELGGVDYIYKPINPELLRAKVAVFVELYKKNMALLLQEQKLLFANKQLEKEVEERKGTERKINILNKQLLDNVQQLKVTNQELERYAFVASHDLQEPLRKIILFGDRLRSKYAEQMNDEAQDYLDRITKASVRMQGLIKNLLDFSRAVADTEEFVETDLNQLVQGILGDLDDTIQSKNAIIKFKNLPVLKIVPLQFRQLFQNLIVNALKFNIPGTVPVINIEGEKVKGMYVSNATYDQYEEYFYKITIQDNGIGFEEQYADQIFSMFKRLHTFEQFEGTGIGLAICKKIVEKYHGTISASGKPNEGATFTIALPVNFKASIHPLSVSSKV